MAALVAAVFGAFGCASPRFVSPSGLSCGAWPGQPGREVAARRASREERTVLQGRTVLRCGKETKIGRLAEAILGQVRDHGAAEVSTLGLESVHAATKAIGVANSASNDSLAIVPFFVNVTFDKGEESEKQVATLRLQVQRVDEPAADMDPCLVSIKRDPAQTLLWGSIMKGEFSKNRGVKLTATGPQAVLNAMRSLVHANSFMQYDGMDTVLGAIPALDDVVLKSGDTISCQAFKVARCKMVS